MSRRRTALLALALGFVVAGSVLAAISGINVYVDGRPVQAQAIVRNGVTYLPVRAVAETLGCTVEWDQVRGAVFIHTPAVLAIAPRTSAPPPPTYAPRSGTHASTDIVHITRTGRKYHRGGCRYLSRSDIPISRSDAKARRYTPCSVCNP